MQIVYYFTGTGSNRLHVANFGGKTCEIIISRAEAARSKKRGQSMKSYNHLLLGAVLLVATACTIVPPEPVVSSFNESSVGIQMNGTTLEFASAESRAVAIAAADARAADICRRGPNRRAEFVSSRIIPINQYAYNVERLYLCLS